ncbi:uncharacterized protein LOC144125118 isoform X2 [Amblyomma americanum]
MDRSCDAAGASAKEQMSREVNIWLCEMLGEGHEIDMDEKGVTAMHKLMTLHKAAEKDALDQMVILEERTKAFNVKAEKLEAALSAAHIAPQQLPESVRSHLKDLSYVATLLGCQDGHPQRIEEKLLSLHQQRKELRSKELELKEDIAKFKELIQTTKNQLASARASVRHISPKDEERRMDAWEKTDQKYQARLARLEKRRAQGPLPQGPGRLLSLSEKLERLALKERILDEKLQPMADLPPDEKAIETMLEAAQRTREFLTKALEKQLKKERAKHEAAQKT